MLITEYKTLNFGKTKSKVVMTKKEKIVMAYLCTRCQQKRTYLVSPQEIAQALSKKFVLSIEEIDEILVVLSNENYLDFVVSESKKGYFYCITLKKCGQSYNADTKKNRKTFGLLILRSMFLATVSFVFGIILKAIFKS